MSKKKYEMIVGIVKSTPAMYCPINVLCNIRLVDGFPESVHRISNGGGTVLRKWESKNTIFEIVQEKTI